MLERGVTKTAWARLARGFFLAVSLALGAIFLWSLDTYPWLRPDLDVFGRRRTMDR